MHSRVTVAGTPVNLHVGAHVRRENTSRLAAAEALVARPRHSSLLTSHWSLPLRKIALRAYRIFLNLVHVSEFRKGPAAVRAEIVDPGHPVGFHGLLLGLSVFAAIAFDFNDEVERVVFAAPVVNADDEVRQVRALDTAEIVRHLETEAMILHVRQHLGMPLRDLAELLSPNRRPGRRS